ncbi:MAG TPA: hypothetical protein VFQ91_14640 [Bryobacteraceae bacterium]|nr:hypothetical protein [Bryobacteraceae bacterium]
MPGLLPFLFVERTPRASRRRLVPANTMAALSPALSPSPSAMVWGTMSASDSSPSSSLSEVRYT